MLGTPLMPWQQHVADTALEIDPDTGLLVYREVGLTVPRQSGKTTLLLAAMVHRALGFNEKQRIIYTAQTRAAARGKWEDEHVAVLESSKLRKMFSVRRQNGQEAIRWKNGSRHGISSNTDKAGHGETLDLGVVDEAFAQDDDRLEQAFKPAMITRPQPQLWYLSTAGTAKSTYLKGKVEAGRERCLAGLTSAACYFEWSAPDDADPADPATWWSCMPALGHTVSEEAVKAEYESMKRPEFRRAFLNQWPDAASDEWQVISEQAWTALFDENSHRVGPIAISADITPDRKSGCIAMAGRRADGLMHVEIIDMRPNTAWMVDRIKELVARKEVCAVVIDGAGPAASLIASLEAAKVEVVKSSSREMQQACGAFYDATVSSEGAPATLRHIGQTPLNVAVAGAIKRNLGDTWAWTRKGSTDISPLVAVSLAAWGYETRSATKKPGSRPKAAYI